MLHRFSVGLIHAKEKSNAKALKKKKERKTLHKSLTMKNFATLKYYYSENKIFKTVKSTTVCLVIKFVCEFL